jgi:hypothetical protein
MSERAPALDDATMQVGLLMESAQTHQRLAETQLEKLRLHTQDLDGVVRDEIRRTLVQELSMLTVETARATRALEKIRRSAARRGALWSMGAAAVCALAPLAVAQWALPSASEIDALRAQQDQLSSSITKLKAQGAGINWRRCGEGKRLCVRVDRKAPAYGDKADYYVIQGY